MTAERRLVLDANILMRAVLGHRVRQIIETHFEHATFFAPEVAFTDAERHLPMVIRKRGGDDAAVREALETLAAVAWNVEVVDPDGYDAHRSAALARIKAVDAHDVTSRPLIGSSAASPWDPALAPAIAREGFAVEEEAVADVLVSDLLGT